MKKKAASPPKWRRITIRARAGQFEEIIQRARAWQELGPGSRSLNDWCLAMLLRDGKGADGKQDHA